MRHAFAALLLVAPLCVALAQSPAVPAPQDDKKAAQAEAKHKKDIEADISQGKEYSAEVDKELKPSKDEAMNARLQRVGGVLAEIARTHQVQVLFGDPRMNVFPYSFKLVQGDDVNAFSIPGGYIYVYEGLMKFVESDDELAGVLAHEISHAAFRHLATIRKKSNPLQLAQLPLLIVAAAAKSSEAMSALMAVQLLNQSYQSGWSVEAETAADYGALQYLKYSPYNPVGELTFMERLAHKDSLGPRVEWGIFQTHPVTEQRARFLMTKLKEAGVEIKRSQVSSTYAARAVQRPDSSVEVWFGKNEIHTFRGGQAASRAQEAVVRINTFMDAVPSMGDAYVQDTIAVRGGDRVLFLVEDDDVKDQGITAGEEAKLSLSRLRKVIYDLGNRLFLITRGGGGRP
ncbi:MAG: M48 family metalloprotease [Fimbriimonadaceae bacterium]|nr:M48 family metalloprotease [Fimbriimonadaceae bacterium]